MVAKKDTSINPDVIKEFLKSNPEILRDAIRSAGGQTLGTPAYSIIGISNREVPVCKMEGTRIVRDKNVTERVFCVRTMNGDILDIPEHCLEDYNIKPGISKIVDEDGLTAKDKSDILNKGAF